MLLQVEVLKLSGAHNLTCNLFERLILSSANLYHVTFKSMDIERLQEFEDFKKSSQGCNLDFDLVTYALRK